MKRTFLLTSILVFILGVVGCVFPYPFEKEPTETTSPPRFIRDSCFPAYSIAVVIDSKDQEVLTLEIQDADIDGDVHFRIFKNYYTCVFDNAESEDCLNTLITEGKISPNSLSSETSDSTEFDEGENISNRTYPFQIAKKLFCSSANGDDSTTSHVIDVVIADAFSGVSGERPFWRAAVGGSDVWTFIVNCVQDMKK
jgi:hypothetical protein